MKIRICYGKTDRGSYLSHLDLARTMERSLRRAKAPLAFSEGFNPHPKLSFASALAVGTTGCREYLDVELAARVNVKALSQALEKALPPALAFVAAEEIRENSKSLSAIVNLAIYRIKVAVKPEDEEKVALGIEKVLAAPELWRKPKEKPGKKPTPAKEVRGLIRQISVLEPQPAGAAAGNGTDNAGGPEKNVELEMVLRLSAEGQLRPQELWEMIAAAGDFEALTPLAVCRRALLIEQGGKRFAPMEGVRD